MKALQNTFLPELGTPKRGKVRDIYDLDNTLALVASDRISVFDCILPNPIEDKGRILTEISKFWFENTQDIVPNHLLNQPDPNVMIVKKCKPIDIEIIVRGYIAGSMWRDYEKGKREKCGVPLPDGLKQNDPLPKPIVTPTTKSHEGHDEDITKEEILEQKIVSKDLWEQIEKVALQLYQRGQEIANNKGMILIDTKYEFGLDTEGNLVLIDEIHTPDSSRFMYKKDFEMKQVRYPDKEFARTWASNQGFNGEGPLPIIPRETQNQIREGYQEIYEMIMGEKLKGQSDCVTKRVLKNLKRNNVIKGTFALILSGSEKDQAHVDKITSVLEENGIPFKSIVGSAHKNPKMVIDLIDQYNESLEPIVCITVAGRSNALSGVVASNLKWPVIACPPFKDHADYLTNIHSSLQMPSLVPAMTVIDPKNAALATVKILKTMEMTS